MFEFQEYETYPRPAYAIQWDGSREMAKGIIEWAEALTDGKPHRNKSGYNEKYENGEFVSSLMIDVTSDSLSFYVVLQKDDWLVSEEDRFSSCDSEDFNDNFRKREYQ